MTTESKVTIKAGDVEITSGLLRTAYIIRIYKDHGNGIDRIGDIVSQHTLKKYVEPLRVAEVKDVYVYRTDTTDKMERIQNYPLLLLS